MKQLTAQQHKDLAAKSQRRAKHLLAHYFELVLETFDSDARAELDEMLDHLLEATTHRVYAMLKTQDVT